MTTTIMRDSVVGDPWITQTQAQVPIQRIFDQQTGEPTNNILTGPVRLAFCDLFAPSDPMPPATEGKYGSHLLFPPNTDFALLYEEYYRLAAQEFADCYDATTGQYFGLHSPFRDQGEKFKFGGYTPGCVFISSTSKYKPPVVDVNHNPIVDMSKVYAGVWAICAVGAYVYGKSPVRPKKGISFGLTSVMIIGDDTSFAGAAPDPKETFKGVNVTAPIVRPDVAQHMPPGAQPPAAGIPGYTAPGGGVPAPAAAPAVAQTHWQPPAATGPTPAQPLPGQPVPPAEDNSWLT